MGFNLSGIVINKDFDKDINKLSEELGLNLGDKEEISFETASSNWTPESECRIYFSEKGTIVFLPYRKFASQMYDGFLIPDSKVLTFAYTATGGLFSFVYYEGKEHKRSICEIDGEVNFENGNKLEIEKASNEVSGLIFYMIENVLGKSFYEIENSEKAFLSRFKN